jgi:tRNA threonylcarbamoyladenosine biosynthesis protein TsaE
VVDKKNIEIVSNSVQRTFEIGRKIGEILEPPKAVCLVGPLGSGKTTVIKGIAAGAGAARPESVNSPTFVMVNEYQGRFNIFHIDAYRVNSIAEFEALGFSDFIGPESVVLIEWADKVAPALKGLDCINIEMRHNGPESRIIIVGGMKNAHLLS